MKESHDILTTDFSSYGQSAAAAGGLIPITCTHFDYCQRRLTAYPGTQQPSPPKMHKCSDNQLLLYPAPDMSAAFLSHYYRFIEHPEINS